jgi:cystathionine gamma-synthase
MSARDALTNPPWRAEDLGCLIPDSPHAVSFALPRWEHVVGYEEHQPAVISHLTSGYPRFVIHPMVSQVTRQLCSDRPALPFPSRSVAEWAAAYTWRTTGEPTQITSGLGIAVVSATTAGYAALKAFWQHTGLIVSSRQAEAILSAQPRHTDDKEVRLSLRRHLAGLYDCSIEDVLLTPTGMAAQFAALRAVNRYRPGHPTAQLGFPYVDTLKLQQKLGHGGILLQDLAHIDTALSELLIHQPLAACFCEIPGNPLLGSADVRRTSPLLRQHRIPLVVDDVVATPYNLDLRPYADLIATSLTKFVAGTGDTMGGALICNPHSPLYTELKPLAQSQHEEQLWIDDAVILERQARSFPERMRQHNRNGLLLAERLRHHPQVERVWYPRWEFSEAYEAVRRPQGGWSSLITFLPKHAESRAARVYDALPLCKGPSLGTQFTLVCPFTMIAHYTELDWAESCGVSRYLIRISAGLEDPEELWQKIDQALTVP